MEKEKTGSRPASEGELRARVYAHSMLSSALDAAASGAHIFPVFEVRPDGSCACEGKTKTCSPGKHPRTGKGHLEATTDEAIIRKWWTTWPDANIGMAARPSGRVVVDVDVKPGRGDGYVELDVVEGKHGKLPVSLRVRTGSGGMHIHLLGQAGDYSPFTALDIRGSGYVLLPPSTHVSGQRYTWLDPDDSRLEAAPEWLLRMLRPPVASIPEVDPAEALAPGASFDPIFNAALRSLAAGVSRHETWLRLALQARDARMPAAALLPYVEPFLAACVRRGDHREVASDELRDIMRWVFARQRRDPHPELEKLLLPDLLDRPVDGDARQALIRRTARIILPIFHRSRFGSLDLGVQLLSVLNDARCRPPLTASERAPIVAAVLEELARRKA